MIHILETTHDDNEAQNTPFRRPIRVVIPTFLWVFLHMLGAFVVLMAQKRYEEMFPVLILSIFLSIVDRWMWMEFLKIFKELGEKRKDKTDVQEGDDEYHVFFTDQVLNEKNECSICLTSSLLVFKKSICGHVFHEECVKKWFLNQITNSLPMSCPICRRSGFVSKRMESIQVLQV